MKHQAYETAVDSRSLLMISKPTWLTAVLFILLTLTLSTSNTYAFDPGYVEAVIADVQEFEQHKFLPPEDSDWLGDKETESAKLADLQGFSEYIRNKSPGSYIFYKKLPIKYRKKLHQDYLATGDLSRAKQDIFKYSREMKQPSRSSQSSR
jgi:hypothetical protein